MKKKTSKTATAVLTRTRLNEEIEREDAGLILHSNGAPRHPDPVYTQERHDAFMREWYKDTGPVEIEQDYDEDGN